jgi:hypothetical protein
MDETELIGFAPDPGGTRWYHTVILTKIREPAMQPKSELEPKTGVGRELSIFTQAASVPLRNAG